MPQWVCFASKPSKRMIQEILKLFWLKGGRNIRKMLLSGNMCWYRGIRFRSPFSILAITLLIIKLHYRKSVRKCARQYSVKHNKVDFDFD